MITLYLLCHLTHIHQRYVRDVPAGNLSNGIPCLSSQCLLRGASAPCDPANDRWIYLDNESSGMLVGTWSKKYIMVCNIVVQLQLGAFVTSHPCTKMINTSVCV